MRGSSRALPNYSKQKASGQAVVRLSGRGVSLVFDQPVVVEAVVGEVL